MAGSAQELPELEIIENAGFRDLDPNGVLEQPFWERYNKHLEMPLGWSIAVLSMVLVFGILVFVQQMNRGGDRRPVPISTLDGDDATGIGSEGSGGQEAPIAIGQPAPASDLARIMQDVPQQDLTDIKEKMKLDIGGDIEIPDSVALPIATLDQKIRDKLVGSKRGDGGAGTGADGNKGGPGGFGHDSTRARGLRWVLLFDTRSGRDYLNQLHAMGGTILVPAADGKNMYIFRDLINPKVGPTASDSDLEKLGENMQFSEIKRDAVQSISEALGIKDFVPSMFMAIFPRKLEEKMADLEVRYRNKRPEDIRQTKYKVLMRGGEFDLIVVDQQYK